MSTLISPQAMTLKLRFDVSRQDVYDLLTTAWEGGHVHAWAAWTSYSMPADVDEVWLDPGDRDDTGRPLWPQYAAPLVGGSVTVDELDENGSVVASLTLDADAIARGLATMQRKYRRHFTDFVNEQADTVTGDVFLQCCLFDGVRYG